MNLVQLAIEAGFEIGTDSVTHQVAITRVPHVVAILPNEMEAEAWLLGYIVGKRVGRIAGISSFNIGLLYAWHTEGLQKT
jgi:hypothetical protein